MTDRLALWSSARDAAIARIDFGAVPARSSGDVTFRVKNQSSQYTARTVVVSTEDVTPGGSSQLLLSLDGLMFAAAVPLGDLAAAAISPVVWLRRTTASDADLMPMECALLVHAGSWVSTSTQ